MELLVIGETKFKLTLTKEETEKYGLKTDGTDPETGNFRTVLRDVPGGLKEKTGFDPADKVLVQCYPSGNGGCEIFVTKRPSVSDGLRERTASNGSFPTCLSARFFSVRPLLQAARALLAAGNAVRSRLYLIPDGSYILALFPEPGAESLSLLRRLGEFSVSACSLPLVYLDEHGRCLISSRAVEQLCAAV